MMQADASGAFKLSCLDPEFHAHKGGKQVVRTLKIFRCIVLSPFQCFFKNLLNEFNICLMLLIIFINLVWKNSAFNVVLC